MRLARRNTWAAIALACGLLTGAAHAEEVETKEPAPKPASLSRAVAELSTVISVRGEPYFGCEKERPGPDSYRLLFPCEDAHLIQSGDEARAIASVSMARLYLEQNPPKKEKRHWSEYVLAGAVAAVGEAIDNAENKGLQREEQRLERTRPYEFNPYRPNQSVPPNRLGLMTMRTIRDVGTCWVALDSALTRLREQGSEAGRAWADQARRQIGEASEMVRTRCYTPRRCVEPDFLNPPHSGSDTSHSENARYRGPVGRPTMVIKCSVQ